MPAQGGHGAPSPSLWAAQHPPLHTLPVPGGLCRAAVGGSRECRRRSLPRGVCPGQTNPRNLGPVYKKPRGCSVPRSIWECLGLEQGLSRCRVITWVLLRPHQSRQPLISGSSWHAKGPCCPQPCVLHRDWDLDGAGIQPHSEPGLVGSIGALSSKKGSFSPRMSCLQPRQREQGAVGVHPNSSPVPAGDVWVAVMSLQVSAPLWRGDGSPHLFHPALTRPRSISASSPPLSWGSQWPEVALKAVGITACLGCQEPRLEPKIPIYVFPLAPPCPFPHAETCTV